MSINNIATPRSKKKSVKSNDHETDYEEEFVEMLSELSKLYKGFPKYMLEIMAKDYGIPAIELKTLESSAKKSGMLIKDGGDDMYYSQKK